MYFFQSWGAEGYHLWVLPNKQERKKPEEQQEDDMVAPSPSFMQFGILQFHFIKSALTVNPCTVRGYNIRFGSTSNPSTHYLSGHVSLFLLPCRVTRSRCCSMVKTASTWPAVTQRRSAARLTLTRTHTSMHVTAAHCTILPATTPLSLRDSALYWDTNTGMWSR